MTAPRRLVHVTWRDSASPGRKWYEPANMKGYSPATCQSVGWLMEDRKDAVVIAASIGESDAGDWTAIPRTCVVKIRRLK